MSNLITLTDLMGEQLVSLYGAESLWLNALKQHSEKVTSRDLSKAFEAGIRVSEEHVRQLKKILDQIGKSTLSHENAVVRGLIDEMEQIQAVSADSEVRDAGLIVTHQCMNHYLIAKYGTVASYARLLNQGTIAASLHAILEEEKKEDRALSKLAEEKINSRARTAII